MTARTLRDRIGPVLGELEAAGWEVVLGDPVRYTGPWESSCRAVAPDGARWTWRSWSYSPEGLAVRVESVLITLAERSPYAPEADPPDADGGDKGAA